MLASALGLMPELRRADGTVDAAAARLLLALVEANGPEWTLTEWLAGGLGPLLRIGETSDHKARAKELQSQTDRLAWRVRELEDERAWLLERHETLERVQEGGWWRLRQRVLPALRLATRVRETVGRRP
jgi:hypothetical protein